LKRWLLAATASALLAGCAEGGRSGSSSIADVFSSPSDQLLTLVEQGRYDNAMTLYESRRKWFQENQVATANQVNLAAAKINAPWEIRFSSVVAACQNIQWPTQRPSWPAIRASLNELRQALDEYPKRDLISEKRQASGYATLDKCIANLTARIATDAPKFLAQEDPRTGANFFRDYPVHVALPELLASRLKATETAPNQETSLFSAASAYAKEMLEFPELGEEFAREAKQLLKAKAALGDLRAVLDLYQREKVAGIQPSTIPVTVGIVSSPAELREFKANLSVDLPFEWRWLTLVDLKAKHLSTEFVIAVFPIASPYKRTVGEYENQNSRLLVGNHQIPNQDFNRAILDLDRAREDLYSARQFYDQANTQAALSGNSGMLIFAAVNYSKAQEAFNSAQQIVASTPQSRTVLDYQPYFYQVAEISAHKEVEWIAYIGNQNGATESYRAKLVKEKKVKVPYNIDPRDEDIASIRGKYGTEREFDDWEKEDLSTSLEAILAEGTRRQVRTSWASVAASVDVGRAESPAIARAKGDGTKTDGRTDLGDRRFSSVVVIRVAGAQGAGFFVTPAIIVTNAHVIEGQKFVTVKTFEEVSLGGKVVAEDRRRDLALIRVDAAKPPVSLSTREIAIGALVEVIGHPAGLQYSLTRGIVSQLRTLHPVSGYGGGLVSYIQLDAAMSPGNSGGPVYQGSDVIGVATWKVSSNGAEGLNFAIHRDELMSFLREQGVSLP